MSKSVLLTNARIVNEGKIFSGHVLIADGRIQEVFSDEDSAFPKVEMINCEGKLLIPGVIDDQVHFREPGLTHKADLFTESRAAVAGGVTSFMDMPNTIPNTLTLDLLEEKFQLAAEKSLANYSFYMGASNHNISELGKADPSKICGIKVFMGSSTGNMLVNDPFALQEIFSLGRIPVAVHCEDETIIQKNTKIFHARYGENIPMECHPLIRSAEACYKSSAYAVELAYKKRTRLHLLHLSTAKEMQLLSNTIPLSEKKITGEVCVYHLWFDESDYARKGSFIKWNPAIKTASDRQALLKAVLNNTLDIIATDHAPHTLEEKQHSYFATPSGGPLVQHSLLMMLELYHRKQISLEKIVEKMCHHPALCFGIRERGFLQKGYYADLVLIDLNASETVSRENIFYKCGWSPLEGETFHSKITHTFVNGNLVYQNGAFNNNEMGMRLSFNR
jgi:dihydroorotase